MSDIISMIVNTPSLSLLFIVTIFVLTLKAIFSYFFSKNEEDNKYRKIGIIIGIISAFLFFYFGMLVNTTLIDTPIGIPKSNKSPTISLNIDRPLVSASRVFSGPTQHPPKSFAAYGIFAFRSRSPFYEDDERKRHMMFCNAYISILPHTIELYPLPSSKQMVTVWPIESDLTATSLNKKHRSQVCKIAVDRYGLVTSLQAIKEAELTSVDINSRGPYLLAWSPAIEKGKKDALVLIADMSNVTTPIEAKKVLSVWVRDIEENPNLWDNGFNIEEFRTSLRQWVDYFGPKIVDVFKSNM